MDNFLGAIKNYMEEKGILFTSDQTGCYIGDAYAIMGGKSSVRLLQNARDGINGIILCCHWDEIDRDNLVMYFGKTVYPNPGDKTRPYKIQILPEELDKVIDVLLLNEKNRIMEKPVEVFKRLA